MDTLNNHIDSRAEDTRRLVKIVNSLFESINAENELIDQIKSNLPRAISNYVELERAGVKNYHQYCINIAALEALFSPNPQLVLSDYKNNKNFQFDIESRIRSARSKLSAELLKLQGETVGVYRSSSANIDKLFELLSK